MDISNIPPSPPPAPPSSKREALAALSHSLNLAIGKTVSAHITATEPVSADERAELLKQTNAALAQIKPAANKAFTPAQQADINRLMQQQTLLQAPALKWVQLLVNNRPLLTYSDRPLVAGQRLSVQLQGPQKLVLLDILSAQAARAPSLSTTGKLISSNLAASNLPSSALKSGENINVLLQAAVAELARAIPTADSRAALIKILLETAAHTTTPSAGNSLGTEQATKTPSASNPRLGLPYADARGYSTSNTQNPAQLSSKQLMGERVLGEQLRRLLPHQDAPNLLLSAVTQLQQLPNARKLALLSPSVAQALKTIAAQIRAPEQLAQPKLLAEAVKRSGVFFEQQLSASAAQTGDVSSNHSARTLFAQDLKGALLTLLSRTTQELTGDQQPPSSTQTLSLLQKLSKPSQPLGTLSPLIAKLEPNIAVFVQQLLQKPVKELSDKELRSQLLMLLQQHSVHSLAKIQLQQLHNLNHELDSQDKPAPTSVWQTELPVKHHGEVQQLQLRIEREWVDEQNGQQAAAKPRKIKQWSVTLRFDLPKLGEFCAELTIIDTQVKATLWAAQTRTFSHLNQALQGLRQQLEQEGIDVKSLECKCGMPPTKALALSYSLIDTSS